MVLLVGYHLYCGRLRRQLEEGTCRWNGRLLRMFNEVPALLLVAIVFIVVLKDLLSWTVLLIILVLLAISILVTIKWYARYRKSVAL